jgi:hypothetical protein
MNRSGPMFTQESEYSITNDCGSNGCPANDRSAPMKKTIRTEMMEREVIGGLCIPNFCSFQ